MRLFRQSAARVDRKDGALSDNEVNNQEVDENANVGDKRCYRRSRNLVAGLQYKEHKDGVQNDIKYSAGSKSEAGVLRIPLAAQKMGHS